MRKGNVVRINNGMWTNQAELLRPTTWEEKEAWRESPESKGMNSAGETKLPPQIVVIDIKGDDLMVVEKSRCARLNTCQWEAIFSSSIRTWLTDQTIKWCYKRAICLG